MEAHPQLEQTAGAQEPHSCQVCPSAAHGSRSAVPAKHTGWDQTQSRSLLLNLQGHSSLFGLEQGSWLLPHTAVTALHCANSFYSLAFSKLPLKFSITNLFPMNSCTMLKFAQEMLDTIVV